MPNLSYRANDTTYTIPFNGCNTYSSIVNQRTAPTLRYYYSGTYYQPLVTSLTTSVDTQADPAHSVAFCCNIYYATNPAIRVHTDECGNLYVANMKQCYSQTATYTCKCGYFTNDYDNPTTGACQLIQTRRCCISMSNISQPVGTGTICSVTPGISKVCCVYSGTCYGRIPTPTEIAACTGVPICTNGIIGNKWINTCTQCTLDYNATCENAITNNCICGRWRYNALVDPTFYLCFSRTSYQVCYLNVTLMKSAVTCFDLTYCFSGSGWIPGRGCIGTESASRTGDFYLSPNWDREASGAYCRIGSGWDANTYCSFYLIICYTYGKKYYYTSGNPGCPNFGSLATIPSSVTITWSNLYCDLYFNK